MGNRTNSVEHDLRLIASLIVAFVAMFIVDAISGRVGMASGDYLTGLEALLRFTDGILIASGVHTLIADAVSLFVFFLMAFGFAYLLCPRMTRTDRDDPLEPS